MRIADILPQGRDHALTARELIVATGMNERELRLAIRAERLNGALILSDPAVGYYLPSSDEDVLRYVCSIRRRVLEVSKLVDAAQEALAQVEGQQRIAVEVGRS